MKDAERVRRGTGDVRFHVIRGEQPIKQWESFFSCSNIKKALINFLVEEWMKIDFTTQHQERILYVTNSEQSFKITTDSVVEIISL